MQLTYYLISLSIVVIKILYIYKKLKIIKLMIGDVVGPFKCLLPKKM